VLAVATNWFSNKKTLSKTFSQLQSTTICTCSLFGQGATTSVAKCEIFYLLFSVFPLRLLKIKGVSTTNIIKTRAVLYLFVPRHLYILDPSDVCVVSGRIINMEKHNPESPLVKHISICT